VLVIDGEGEEWSVSIYDASDDGIRIVRRWGREVSLGFLYRTVTRYCGFGWFGPGKTMGLAGYASRDRDPLPLRWTGDDLRSPFSPGTDETYLVEAWSRLLVERFGAPVTAGPQRSGFLPVEAHKPEAAAAAQKTVELAVQALSDYALRTVDTANLCLAGGVALNCVANGLVSASPARLYIPPAAHDAGAALGAALQASADAGQRHQGEIGAYLGPKYGRRAISDALQRAGLAYETVDDPAARAAGAIARGEIVAWFQDEMEVGPRALGHRSILALPSASDMKDRVNAVKGREPWRPLAPSILRDELSDLFVDAIASPYMLLSFALTDDAMALVPAVAHVDGSARLQTVDPEDGRFGQLLTSLQGLTGVGAVLNTSFNGPGEPIVCSPAEAISTFTTLDLDTLVMGDCVVQKERKG
jgi:carbamoyltransferase